MAGPGSPFGTPLFSGSQSADDVPGRLPVGLAGRSYLLDLTGYSRRTIPSRRQPIDDGSEVGDNSLNTEGLWTRSASDWSLGSGQEYFDGPESERRRFSRSMGIDPWERDALTLLPESEQKRSSANTNLRILAAGSRLYIADGNTVLYTTDPSVSSPSWTTVTGTPAASVLDMTTDGYDVYVAFGASDLYKIAGGGSAATTLGTTDTDTVEYVNGRLLAGHDNIVYEVDNAGTYTTEFTHPLTAWQVRGFTRSPSFGYFWGDTGSGDTEIYRIGVQESGALAAAVYSGTLPAGEILYEMDYYAGFMLLATSLGVRAAQIAGDGSLVVGPAIEVTGGSRCVAAASQFVWFGWNSPYGETSTGLGRADLSRLLVEGIPPYATDIQTATTGTVLAAETFDGVRYFAVSAVGFYGATGDLVATGWFETGRIRYSTLEKKVSVQARVSHEELVGTATVALRSANKPSAFVSVGLSNVVGSVLKDSIDATGYDGEWQEVKVTLARSATDATAGPTLRMLALRSLPSPRRIREIIAPLVIRSQIATHHPSAANVDVAGEIGFLEALEESGRIVLWQEGTRTYKVYVDRMDVSGQSPLELDWTDDRGTIEGNVTLRLLTVPS